MTNEPAPQDVIDRLVAAGPDLTPELMTQLLDTLRDKAVLGEAIVDLCWKATPYGGGDTVQAYLLPSGTVHRLIGVAQGVGIPAAFRSMPEPAEEEPPVDEPIVGLPEVVEPETEVGL